jgi:putative endonuclease
MHKYFVYILSSPDNQYIYIGVTNNLERRIKEHREKLNQSYTSKMNCVKLVWFEMYRYINSAIAREKQLKNWQRKWKNELIEKYNPKWEELGFYRCQTNNSLNQD